MALIVEDGSNVANADCYADASALAAWEIAYFGAASTGATAVIEAAIRRAVLFIDAQNLKGSPTDGRSQSRALPRTDMDDINGNAIAVNEIPVEFINAQHALARAEIASPNLLSPSVTPKDAKVLVQAGELKWKSLASDNDIEASRPIVTMAADLMAGFVTPDLSDVAVGMLSIGGFSDG